MPESGPLSVILPPVPVDRATSEGLLIIARIESVTPAALVRRVLGQYVTEYPGLPD
jgi:hypothetical protein